MRVDAGTTSQTSSSAKEQEQRTEHQIYDLIRLQIPCHPSTQHRPYHKASPQPGRPTTGPAENRAQINQVSPDKTGASEKKINIPPAPSQKHGSLS